MLQGAKLAPYTIYAYMIAAHFQVTPPTSGEAPSVLGEARPPGASPCRRPWEEKRDMEGKRKGGGEERKGDKRGEEEGWPIASAPRSASVFAEKTGMLDTDFDGTWNIVGQKSFYNSMLDSKLPLIVS